MGRTVLILGQKDSELTPDPLECGPYLPGLGALRR